jgi:hypothetical protein
MRLAVLIVTAILATAANAQAKADTPSLTLAHGGQTARTTIGSFCASGMCVDRIHPARPAEKLDVQGGDGVALRFDLRAKKVSVHLLRIRVDGTGKVGRRVTAVRVARKRWRVRLPDHLRRANALDVFARGHGWDASFWGGLRRRSTR